MVVAQLAQHSLPKPEYRTSHPADSNFIQSICFLLTVEKTKLKPRIIAMTHLKM